MYSICSSRFLGDSLLYILRQLYRPTRRCLQRTKNYQEPCMQRNYGMLRKCFIQSKNYHMIHHEFTSVSDSVTSQRHIVNSCVTEASLGNGPILTARGPMWTPLFEYRIHSNLFIIFLEGRGEGLVEVRGLSCLLSILVLDTGSLL